jgi:hypothetical protein
MNAIQRRQYEMLLRLRDFGNTNKDLFAESPVGQEAFSSLNAAVDQLTATDLVQLTASTGARENRKARTQRALLDVLMKASTLARVLRARGHTTPPFVMPAAKNTQVLLTAARQFARDAGALETEFTGHGVGPKVIADAAHAFEMAVRDRGFKRADHMAATTRIAELLATALLDVRRLDLIVDSELAGNSSILSVWKQVRRLEAARVRRGTAAANTEPSSPEPPASPVLDDEPVVVDAPAPAAVATPVEEPARTSAPETPATATVIQMPLREAA